MAAPLYIFEKDYKIKGVNYQIRTDNQILKTNDEIAIALEIFTNIPISTIKS